MYPITVVNICVNPQAEYIGRSSGFGLSVLANPWSITSTDTRDAVCDRYDDYFQDQVRTNLTFMVELTRLHRVGVDNGYLNLGCYCAPRHRCHGDTIKRFLEFNQDLFLDQF